MKKRRQFGKQKLFKSNKVAYSVTEKKLYFIGECICNVTFRGETKRTIIYLLKKITKPIEHRIHGVIENVVATVKSSDEVEQLRQKIKKLFPNVFFEGLHFCTKTKAKITVKEEATPVFWRKRNVPFVTLDQVIKELERLESLAIIEKVDHSDWAAPTVYVKNNNNKLRVCANFSTGLNDCLFEHNYPLPNPEEVFSKLNGGKVFFSEACLQIQVEEDCAHLLTTSAYRGLYKFERLLLQ
ncbi:uncharacterized protein K02A2.6-like [Octopus bimaculoides]|uniref:uncharacterized protein K02A2.6-like n=1 Tax=Octopus bimaculoides TaxID=37653 RepID=UPI00071DB61C|nr:uncharacterized protein K02A2.6-like [Octopus bimaculoides]|eukprot:XP_014779680.1 PREDICTED: uncharacterized protein K02A2.6-like [Octopus bimaculoides]